MRQRAVCFHLVLEKESLPDPLYNQLLKASVYREGIPGSGLRLDQATTNHVETV